MCFKCRNTFLDAILELSWIFTSVRLICIEKFLLTRTLDTILRSLLLIDLSCIYYKVSYIGIICYCNQTDPIQLYCKVFLSICDNGRKKQCLYNKSLTLTNISSAIIIMLPLLFCHIYVFFLFSPF